MASDKLSTFNLALTAHLGQTPLASLVEAVEAQRVLSTLWDGVIAYCAEQGYWRFGMKSQLLNADDAVEPTFGPAYALRLPTDCLKLFQVSDNERFNPVYNGYTLEQRILYSDLPELYVRFVSNALATDPANWTGAYTNYVAVRLARLACKRFTQSRDMVEDLKVEEKRAKAVAASLDAMQVEVRQLPLNSWARSRGSSFSRELGNTSSLIG